ncbi:MAG: helix-turn-helix domain-containing protein [Anaeroplasma sp.]
MRFLLLKKTFNDSSTIVNVLKSLIGASIKYNESDSFIVFYHSYPNLEDLNYTMHALANELPFSLIAYNSMDSSIARLQREEKIAECLIDDLSANIYDLKSALLSKKNIDNKSDIIDFILESTGINTKFIKDFAECDLNISKASKTLYVHRNTMLYKLDKLYSLTGFDLRCFKDAYILYSLVL